MKWEWVYLYPIVSILLVGVVVRLYWREFRGEFAPCKCEYSGDPWRDTHPEAGMKCRARWKETNGKERN